MPYSCASLMLAMEVLARKSSPRQRSGRLRLIGVTKDVYVHLPASPKMKAAEAMRKTLWLEEFAGFRAYPAAKSATSADGSEANDSLTGRAARAPRYLNPRPAD